MRTSISLFCAGWCQSIRANRIGIAMMAFSAVLVAAGQLFWKISDGLILGWLALGFCCYGGGAVLMIMSFKYGKLSIVHPIMSLSYVWGIWFGTVFLGETLDIASLFGLMMVILGVMLVCGGDR